MIPQAFVQELLNRLDIVEVVERYLPLKRAGANYVACCPFHNEKTPSFSVSPTKQFYHCFGCGAHGTAIGFVMEHQGLGFVEAVEDLARSAGMTVPEEEAHAGRKADAGLDGLADVMQCATRYYRDELKRSESAIAYLKSRGLSGEIAARFGIGYAPDGWQNLSAVFSDYPTAPALAKAGLVIDSEGGRRYDRFRDRIMFPILGNRGAVIGFGGRVLGEGEPKYLNSPETPLFEKGREIYGLFQARQAIRAAKKVLVVEGYMDVVALAQHGIDYAVATLGTATTPYHIQLLLRQTDDIVFCFDGDNAGRKAAWRALENSLEWITDGKGVGFLFLPQGEDPDSYVRQNGREDFERLLSEAQPLSQFLMRELTGRVDMHSEEGRARFLQLAKPLVEKVSAKALSLMLRKRIGELAGLSPEEVGSLVGARQAAKPAVRRAVDKRMPQSVGRLLLQLVMLQPALAAGLDRALLDTRQADMQALAELLDFVQANTPGDLKAAHILHHFESSPLQTLLLDAARNLEWEQFSDEEREQEFAAVVDKLREQVRNRESRTILAEMQGKDFKLWTPEEKRLYLEQSRRDTVSPEK
ncbi:MAG: DNA primase [Sulfuricellaceae bacterium]|nr:DNA primase [Sulfuricellaceae bacterium]